MVPQSFSWDWAKLCIYLMLSYELEVVTCCNFYAGVYKIEACKIMAYPWLSRVERHYDCLCHLSGHPYVPHPILPPIHVYYCMHAHLYVFLYVTIFYVCDERIVFHIMSNYWQAVIKLVLFFGNFHCVSYHDDWPVHCLLMMMLCWPKYFKHLIHTQSTLAGPSTQASLLTEYNSCLIFLFLCPHGLHSLLWYNDYYFKFNISIIQETILMIYIGISY